MKMHKPNAQISEDEWWPPNQFSKLLEFIIVQELLGELWRGMRWKSKK